MLRNLLPMLWPFVIAHYKHLDKLILTRIILSFPVLYHISHCTLKRDCLKQSFHTLDSVLIDLVNSKKLISNF